MAGGEGSDAVLTQQVDFFRPNPAMRNFVDYGEQVVIPTFEATRYPGIITFNIEPSETLFTALQFGLRLTLHIKKIANGEVKDMEVTGDDCTFVDDPAHSIFSNVDVSFNGQLVDSSGSHYPYLAYIRDNISTSAAVKRDILRDTQLLT